MDPDFQVILEDEANYGASTLMFGADVFTKDAMDTRPEWDSINKLMKVYKTSYVTTLRRYVQYSHEIPMSIVVSTGWWDETPEDQEHRVRHFIRSKKFEMRFRNVSDDFVLKEIDDNTNKRRGGPVGEFEMCLPDVNGDLHDFYAESFYNQHYVLTMIVHQKKMHCKL